MIQKKNVVVSVILSIVTCGLYILYWMASITNNVADVRRDNTYRTGGMVVLLTLITCGLYGLYWIFVTSRDIYYIEEDLGMRTSDNSLINVIFAIFSINIIALAIMQSSINNISDELQNHYE